MARGGNPSAPSASVRRNPMARVKRPASNVALFIMDPTSRDKQTRGLGVGGGSGRSREDIYSGWLRGPAANRLRLLPLNLERGLCFPQLVEAVVAVLQGFNGLVEQAEDELAVLGVALDGPRLAFGEEGYTVMASARKALLAHDSAERL